MTPDPDDTTRADPPLRPEVIDADRAERGRGEVGATDDGSAFGDGRGEAGPGVGPDGSPTAEQQAEEDAGAVESIERPGKVLRIGSMVKQLLDEVRQAPLDEAGRQRLREIYEQSVRELSDGLSEELSEELDRVAIPFGEDTPSEAELRVAQAQLVGWLEGLFHGIQAALVAQQVAARAQLDEMRQRALPTGQDVGPGRPGTYL